MLFTQIQSIYTKDWNNEPLNASRHKDIQYVFSWQIAIISTLCPLYFIMRNGVQSPKETQTESNFDAKERRLL